MNSLIVTDASYIEPSKKTSYSELRVLESAAGYYVGTTYMTEDGFTEPGSRDSDYFPRKQQAERFLKTLLNVINPQEESRDAA